MAWENRSLSPPSNVYMLHSYEDAFLSQDSGSSSSSSFFIIDSRASAHMCHDCSHYSSYHKIDPPRSIYMANNGVLEAVGVSDIIICTHHNGQSKSTLIKGALHLPRLHTSFLSIAQLADAGVRTISDPQHINLIDIHTGKVKDCALRFHNLYKLKVEIIYPDVANVTQSHLPSKASLAFLHHCLHHISEDTILRMVQSKAITGMEVVGDRSELGSACHK